MSRHVFDSSEQRWTVGWDVGMGTFYAQVETPSPVASGEELLRDVLGLYPGELASVTQLRTALAPHVELPAAVSARLDREAQAAAGPVAATVAAMGPQVDTAAYHAVLAAAFPSLPQSAVSTSPATSSTTAREAAAAVRSGAANVAEGGREQ